MKPLDEPNPTEDFQDSFEFTKRNMHFALKEMKTIMKLCSEYVQNTTQIDAIETFANLGKAYTMMNKNLLDFEERSRKNQLLEPSQSDSKLSENSPVVYASTSEIQQALRVVQRNSNVELQK